jgi:hypothetical protein
MNRPKKPKREGKKMAQDQTLKRRGIASRTVVAATKLQDALHELKGLSVERAKCGSDFADEDFGPEQDLGHLTPYMVGSFLDTHAPAISAFVEDVGTPARREILIQLRR